MILIYIFVVVVVVIRANGTNKAVRKDSGEKTGATVALADALEISTQHSHMALAGQECPGTHCGHCDQGAPVPPTQAFLIHSVCVAIKSREFASKATKNFRQENCVALKPSLPPQ